MGDIVKKQSVQDIAAELLEKYGENFSRKEENENVFPLKLALTGVLKGMANGNITVGQAWAGQLLLKEATVDYSDREIIAEAFASGMFCDGQPLDNSREKSFATSIRDR